MKKKTKIILAICLTIFLVLGISCYAYVSDYYHADENALAAMDENDNEIQIINEKNVIWFVPQNPVAGMIFYPGGKVENIAYAPLMRECAKNGILCALVEMPGNLAVLDMDAANGLMEEYPKIDDWYMSGHSLGGSMAANYAAEHDDEFDGLILLAAYSTKNLSKTTLSVLSIYGSNDGVLNRENYEKNRENLPNDAVEVVIDGGCHAQFGSYGAQNGDGIPTISTEEQIERTADEIISFIE